MSPAVRKVEAITREIRACFNRLRAIGDALHGDLGITSAMRAVMESLDAAGGQTVARIARSKSVSRQHVQVLANQLIERGFVESQPDPADRRAPRLSLTKAGRSTFAKMRTREQSVLSELGRALAKQDLDASLAMLEALHGCLDRKLIVHTSSD